MAETPSQSVKAPLRLQSAAESLGAFYEWFATASGAIGPPNWRASINKYLAQKRKNLREEPLEREDGSGVV